MNHHAHSLFAHILPALVFLIALNGCGDDVLTASSSGEAPTTPDVPVTPDSPECETPEPALFSVSNDEPAELLLVLDRSGSMTESGQWMELQRSLESLLVAFDESIAFGLLLFPEIGFNACGVGDVSISPALRSGTRILDLIGRATPLGGTPTADALIKAKAHLETLPATRKAVILATDGGPGCNSDLDWSTCECIEGSMCTGFAANCLDDTRTLNAVNLLSRAALPTYVVGIPGSEGVNDLLDRMAVPGGTDIDGEHLAISSERSLASTFSDIAVDWSPCSFPIIPDQPLERVTVDGQEVAESAQGYTISSDGRTLTFGGTACGLLRDTDVHEVKIEYGCP